MKVGQATGREVHGPELSLVDAHGAYFLWFGHGPSPHTMDQRVSVVVQVSNSGELLLQHYCTFALCYIGNSNLPQIQHLTEIKVVHFPWQLLDVLHVIGCLYLREHFELKRSP
ncbi:hypothetical protein D3C84_1066890 [compost metagenome]